VDGFVERSVLDAVERGFDPASIPGDPSRVRITLGMLEAKGFIRRTGIGSYERAAS
jgi:hypothetical protein